MSYDVVTTIWPTLTLTVTDSEALALFAQGLLVSSNPTIGVSVTAATPRYDGGTASGRTGLIKIRYGTSSEWATAEASTAQVAAGEVVLTDTGFVRGDGATKVASLSRVGGGSTIDGGTP